MDSLSSLPTSNVTQINPQENDIMDQFFDNKDEVVEEKNQEKSENREGEKGDVWRKIIYITIAFIIVANPLTEIFLSTIPQLQDAMIMNFLVRCVLFIVLLTIIQLYL